MRDHATYPSTFLTYLRTPEIAKYNTQSVSVKVYARNVYERGRRLTETREIRLFLTTAIIAAAVAAVVVMPLHWLGAYCRPLSW